MLRCFYKGVLLIALVAILVACDRGMNSVTSKITGKQGEILIISPLSIERTALRDSLDTILHQEFPYIPQSEPRFTTIYVTEKAFGNVLKSFRNILMIHFNADSITPSLHLEKDKWAKEQRILSLYGTDQRTLAEFVGKNKELIISLFEEFERDRMQTVNAALRNRTITDSLQNLFGVSLTIPQGYSLRRAADNFRWYSIETSDISQGLLIYKYKRFDTTPWIPDSVIAHRNAVTKEYVPGPTAGTYMKVSTVVPPEFSILKMGQDSVCFVRGFWEVQGHAMGGAYISYSHLSSNRDSVVVTDGYIYAPRFKKRDYVRALEAILQSQFNTR